MVLLYCGGILLCVFCCRGMCWFKFFYILVDWVWFESVVVVLVVVFVVLIVYWLMMWIVGYV